MKIYILLRSIARGVTLCLYLCLSVCLSLSLSIFLDTWDFSRGLQFSMVRFEVPPHFFIPYTVQSVYLHHVYVSIPPYHARKICQMHIQFWKSTVFSTKENFYNWRGFPHKFQNTEQSYIVWVRVTFWTPRFI